jgi:hypothetical protein
MENLEFGHVSFSARLLLTFRFAAGSGFLYNCGQDCNQFIRLFGQVAQLVGGNNTCFHEEPNPIIGLSGFFEGDIAFRDEISFTLCSRSLFQIGPDRCARAQKLSAQNLSTDSILCNGFVELNDSASEQKGPLLNIPFFVLLFIFAHCSFFLPSRQFSILNSQF